MENLPLFASDLHLRHKHILNFCRKTRRGFDSDEMTELLIATWNQSVKPDDLVYITGDMSFGSQEQTVADMNRMNGVWILTLGNHDKEGVMHKSRRFKEINRYMEIRINQQKVVLFHYPIVEWNGMQKGSYHLFGHVHGNYKGLGRSMDIGIDARPDNLMIPWTWREIDSKLKNVPVLERKRNENCNRNSPPR